MDELTHDLKTIAELLKRLTAALDKLYNDIKEKKGVVG